MTESKTATVATTAAAKEEMQLKIAEAKETVRHFASDIKEAVQNYKPPFTRIKIQLNPVKLGEVDVTMIQRGNNLHINISSNTAAVTTLAQNASELRTQLSQNGMGNTTMNFSSNANAEQQQQQQRHHMAELYEAYENSDNFEVFEQLELTIPQYV
jgi:flagellar hook-length control protein FliK